MTVLENMQAVLPSLPKNERKAAEYLLNYRTISSAEVLRSLHRMLASHAVPSFVYARNSDIRDGLSSNMPIFMNRLWRLLHRSTTS